MDDENEKYCKKCGEWWPETDEFFYRAASGKLSTPCKACILEKRHDKNRTEKCCVFGCNEPRAGEAYSRCKKHLREKQQIYQQNYRQRQRQQRTAK